MEFEPGGIAHAENMRSFSFPVDRSPPVIVTGVTAGSLQFLYSLGES
jgi:hypothetical protein